MNKLRYMLFRAIVASMWVGLLLWILFGCGSIPLTHDQCNATKYATAMEHEQCLRAATDYEQAQHDKEDKKLIRRDKLIATLNACETSSRGVVMEVIRGPSRSCLPNQRAKAKAVKEYGYPYTHGNVCQRANLVTINCVDRDWLRDELRRIGY